MFTYVMVWNVVYLCSDVVRKGILNGRRDEGKFELVDFRVENMSKLVLTADNIIETDKIKILRTTERLLVRHVYL